MKSMLLYLVVLLLFVSPGLAQQPATAPAQHPGHAPAANPPAPSADRI